MQISVKKDDPTILCVNSSPNEAKSNNALDSLAQRSLEIAGGFEKLAEEVMASTSDSMPVSSIRGVAEMVGRLRGAPVPDIQFPSEYLEIISGPRPTAQVLAEICEEVKAAESALKRRRECFSYFHKRLSDEAE